MEKGHSLTTVLNDCFATVPRMDFGGTRDMVTPVSMPFYQLRQKKTVFQTRGDSGDEVVR